ncbi:Uncharacterised protein [Mycobacterium tuberculosis]|nr:Uncharacterised protein [Mycobacterium tuberculosis]
MVAAAAVLAVLIAEPIRAASAAAVDTNCGATLTNDIEILLTAPPLPHKMPPAPPLPINPAAPPAPPAPPFAPASKGRPWPPAPPAPPLPINPAAPPAPPACPGAPDPPLPPLPHKMPPAPPACPVPGAPWAPSPISLRPTSASVGVLITPNRACSICCSGVALAASATA